MKQYSTPAILSSIAVCLLATFAVMAFQDPSAITKKPKTAMLDTLPKNTTEIDINLADVNQRLIKSLETIEKSIKGIEWKHISEQIEQGLKQIDAAKLQMQIENSMKKGDWDKIKVEIQRSMPAKDMDKMKVDMERMRRDIRQSLEGIHTDAMRNSLEELKKINFGALKKEMEKMKKEMELNKDHFKFEFNRDELH